jgi:hypothetical protein
MISSTPSSDRPVRPDALSAAAQKAPGRTAGPGADQLSLDKVQLLRAALSAQPEIRPEVVARGRALAADPSWPPPAVMQRVSEMILKAPDLTEDIS